MLLKSVVPVEPGERRHVRKEKGRAGWLWRVVDVVKAVDEVRASGTEQTDWSGGAGKWSVKADWPLCVCGLANGELDGSDCSGSNVASPAE